MLAAACTKRPLHLIYLDEYECANKKKLVPNFDKVRTMNVTEVAAILPKKEK